MRAQGQPEGKEMLFGFLDSKWESAETKGQKRCVMNIIPDVGSYEGIRIVTASHCLPDFGETDDIESTFTAQIAYNGGFFPLRVNIPAFEKYLKLTRFINKYVRPNTSNEALGKWLPEFATKMCTDLTLEFKNTGKINSKTACFSHLDLVVLNANIADSKTSSLKKYKALHDSLNRVRGAAQKNLPETLRKDFGKLWGSRSLGEIRARNLRTIAYLSNPQYCKSLELDADSADRAFEVSAVCDIKRGVLENLFSRLGSEELESELKHISTDVTTPLDELKSQFSGCLRSAFDEVEDAESTCTPELRAKRAFKRLVHQAREYLESIDEKERRDISIANYHKIVTAKQSDGGAYSYTILPVNGNSSRTNERNENTHEGFLFDYMPTESTFDFDRGHSGSLLNIFGGYPVAALSKVDGEPTSGGSGLTPFPEPRDEDEGVSPPRSLDSNINCQ
ncbi:MAG: hypothetical protein RJB13_1217 [Pseudomonadota bacterium]